MPTRRAPRKEPPWRWRLPNISALQEPSLTRFRTASACGNAHEQEPTHSGFLTPRQPSGLAGQPVQPLPLAGMAVAAPEPVSFNPWKRLAHDLRVERAWDGPLPPGPDRFSFSRTRKGATDPLPVLLDCYREYGPVFSMRILHANGLFMIGPEANHHILVSHAENFRWRDGGFIDLIPLLGDGLLTIDGGYHRRARRIMLPAFH